MLVIKNQESNGDVLEEKAPYKFEIEMIKNREFDAKMKEKVLETP